MHGRIIAGIIIALPPQERAINIIVIDISRLPDRRGFLNWPWWRGGSVDQS